MMIDYKVFILYLFAIFGALALSFILISFINRIIIHFITKKQQKEMLHEFRGTLKDSNFFEECFKPMTKEEKEKLKTEGNNESSITLQFKEDGSIDVEKKK